MQDHSDHEKRSSAEMHLVIEDQVDFTVVIASAKRVLAERFSITHATSRSSVRPAVARVRRRGMNTPKRQRAYWAVIIRGAGPMGTGPSRISPSFRISGRRI